MMKKILFLTMIFCAMLQLHGSRTYLPTNIRDTISIADDSTAVDSIAVDTTKTDSTDTDSTDTDSIVGIKRLTVQERIEKLLEGNLFKTSQVGLMVYDLTADTVVYAYNERQTLRPASTQKLTTAITALDRLGGAYRFTTTLKYNGAIYDASLPGRDERKSNVLVGNIIVVGGMDPRFGSDDMNAFVEALQKQHIDTIYGEIKEDRSFKDADLLGKGWCWDDKNPVLTPLPWNRKDQFVQKFSQMVRNAGIVMRQRGDIPRDSLGNRLYSSMREHTDTLISRHHSMEQILVKMMKESDNLYAESMFYQIAASATKTKQHGRGKDAAEVVKALIRKVGLNPANYYVADGSGLSLYNYQSAELQIKLLRYAFRNSNIYEALYPSLPIAGVDGTLSKRMVKSKARGNVHAKTGTLTGVSSLSGYLTAANGNTLCFAIINQGMQSSSPAKNFQDHVCNILCDY